MPAQRKFSENIDPHSLSWIDIKYPEHIRQIDWPDFQPLSCAASFRECRSQLNWVARAECRRGDGEFQKLLSVFVGEPNALWEPDKKSRPLSEQVASTGPVLDRTPLP